MLARQLAANTVARGAWRGPRILHRATLYLPASASATVVQGWGVQSPGVGIGPARPSHRFAAFEPEVWQNVSDNLSRQPLKQGALAMLREEHQSRARPGP
jgi:hypothetical protein